MKLQSDIGWGCSYLKVWVSWSSKIVPSYGCQWMLTVGWDLSWGCPCMAHVVWAFHTIVALLYGGSKLASLACPAPSWGRLEGRASLDSWSLQCDSQDVSSGLQETKAEAISPFKDEAWTGVISLLLYTVCQAVTDHPGFKGRENTFHLLMGRETKN